MRGCWAEIKLHQLHTAVYVQIGNSERVSESWARVLQGGRRSAAKSLYFGVFLGGVGRGLVAEQAVRSNIGDWNRPDNSDMSVGTLLYSVVRSGSSAHGQ